MSGEADRIIRRLHLKPHPEGGHYRETFRDAAKRGRAHSTAIYFLLKRGEESRWHRIDAAEIWHFYAGAPLELRIANGNRSKRHILGNDLTQNQSPQIVVPAQAWQCAKSLGDYTLVGCTVAPGFEFEKFELAPDDFKSTKISTRRRGAVKAIVRAKENGEGNSRASAQEEYL